VKTQTEITAEIARVSEGIATYERGLQEALQDIKENGLTYMRHVKNGQGSFEEERPNPAIRTQRECISAIRSLTRYLNDLRKQEQRLIEAARSTTNRFSKFVKGRTA